jgi:hypothetical protein
MNDTRDGKTILNLEELVEWVLSPSPFGLEDLETRELDGRIITVGCDAPLEPESEQERKRRTR